MGIRGGKGVFYQVERELRNKVPSQASERGREGGKNEQRRGEASRREGTQPTAPHTSERGREGGKNEQRRSGVSRREGTKQTAPQTSERRKEGGKNEQRRECGVGYREMEWGERLRLLVIASGGNQTDEGIWKRRGTLQSAETRGWGKGGWVN